MTSLSYLILVGVVCFVGGAVLQHTNFFGWAWSKFPWSKKG